MNELYKLLTIKNNIEKERTDFSFNKDTVINNIINNRTLAKINNQLSKYTDEEIHQVKKELGIE